MPVDGPHAAPDPADESLAAVPERYRIFDEGTSDQFTTTKTVSLSCATDQRDWWVPMDVDEQERGFVSVNPSFHAMPPRIGTVLYDGPGKGTYTISLDTTALANGSHKLFIRTNDGGATSPPGINSGIPLLVSTVAN